MSESATYSVVLSGNLMPGFELDWVTNAFARIFKLPLEHAGNIIGTPYVVKRRVDLHVAKSYEIRLSGIGVEVILERTGGDVDLELGPAVQPVYEIEGQIDVLLPGEDDMICPKCEQRQAKAEQCGNCGAFIHKALQHTTQAAAEPQPDAAIREETVEIVESVVQSSGPIDLKWMVAPAVVAVVCAMWSYLIATKFEIELGMIAWAIGWAIGYAALNSGSRGDSIGVFCGVLALLSICSGKFMIISSQQTALADLLSPNSMPYEAIELKAMYEQDLIDAREFLDVDDDDASLRRFMADNGYSNAPWHKLVTDAELEAFRERAMPRLIDIALNQPGFDTWQRQGRSPSAREITPFDLLSGSLSLSEILFLFLGVGTAFRFASWGSKPARLA